MDIQFEGKRVDNGEYVCGDLIHRQIWRSSLTIIRVSDDGFDHYEEYEVDPSTVRPICTADCKYKIITSENIKKLRECYFEVNTKEFGNVYVISEGDLENWLKELNHE